jgi:DNA-binding IscR family transcriptional regulator
MDISVLFVVEAIDGRKQLFDCKGIRGQRALFEGPTPALAVDGVCLVHAVMLEAEERTREALASQRLGDLAR